MIYLDNAATSRFKPAVALTEIFDSIKNSANPGRSGHRDSLNAGIKIFNTREIIKQFLQIKDKSQYEVVFTKNCTEALNLAIFGYINNLKLDYIPTVITSCMEHNSILRPLTHLRNLGKIKLKFVSPAPNKISPTDIQGLIDNETVMIAITHTSNVTGFSNDIFEIGKITKSRNVKLLVDCAQSLGHIPLNITDCNIDMLACAGHKGLHGIQGSGFLVFDKEIQLCPLMFGGTGTNSESLNQPTMYPESLESGTLNTPAIASLGKSIEWTDTNFKNLHYKYCKLSSELHYGLKQIKNVKLYSEYPSSVITFNLKDYQSSDIADFLADNCIEVRSGLHCAPLIHTNLGTIKQGAVRVSVGYNNSLKDIEKLLEAISKAETFVY